MGLLDMFGKINHAKEPMPASASYSAFIICQKAIPEKNIGMMTSSCSMHALINEYGEGKYPYVFFTIESLSKYIRENVFGYASAQVHIYNLMILLETSESIKFMQDAELSLKDKQTNEQYVNALNIQDADCFIMDDETLGLIADDKIAPGIQNEDLFMAACLFGYDSVLEKQLWPQFMRSIDTYKISPSLVFKAVEHIGKEQVLSTYQSFFKKSDDWIPAFEARLRYIITDRTM